MRQRTDTFVATVPQVTSSKGTFAAGIVAFPGEIAAPRICRISSQICKGFNGWRCGPGTYDPVTKSGEFA